MKRSHLVFAFAPMLVALTFAAGSCSTENSGEGPKEVSTYDPNSEEGDAGGGGSLSAEDLNDASVAPPDASFEPLRRIESTAQALQVLLTAYDIQQKEGEIGKNEGNTPPMKAFAADVVEEGKAGKARIRAAARAADVTPKSSMVSDQLKFESQASISHLRNTFQNMFNSNWCGRQVDAASALIRLIDQDLERVMQDDGMKDVLATTRDQAEKRKARAEAVRNGLGDVGSSDGMFPEQEYPEYEGPVAPEEEAPAEDEDDDD